MTKVLILGANGQLARNCGGDSARLTFVT